MRHSHNQFVNTLDTNKPSQEENHKLVIFQTVKLPNLLCLLRRHTLRIILLRINSVITHENLVPWKPELYQLILHSVRHCHDHVSHVAASRLDITHDAGAVSQSPPFLGGVNMES